MNLPNQKVVERFVIPCAATLFGVCTITASLNISIVWIELASKFMKYITEKTMITSRKIIVCCVFFYAVAVFLTMTVVNSYSGAVIINGFAAIVIASTFWVGARMISKKLKVSIQNQQKIDAPIPLSGKEEGRGSSQDSRPYQPYSIFSIKPTTVKFSQKHTHRTLIKVSPAAKEFSLGNVNNSEDCPEIDHHRIEKLAKVAKNIIHSAWSISVNCWSYLCASVVYAIFSTSPHLGVIATVSGMITVLLTLRINALIVQYLVRLNQMLSRADSNN